MNIFKKINKNDMKEHKAKSITLIIAIAISACLVTMVSTFMTNIIDTMEKSAEDTSGNYYISMKDEDDTYYNKFIRDKDVEHIIKTYELGEYTLAYGGEEYNCSDFIASDSESLDKKDLEITEGRMPNNTNEIILSTTIAENLYEKGNIGEKISLEIENKGNKIEKEFIIVGHYLTNGMSNSNIIFCGIDSSIDSLAKLEIKLKDGLFDTKVDDFIEKYNIPEGDYELNDYLLSFKGIQKIQLIFTKFMLLFGIFYIVVGIVSVIIITNGISISINNKRRQFGLLSTVGATKRQLKNMMLNEVKNAALIGVPIGFVIGILLMKIFSNYFLHSVEKLVGSDIDFNYRISLIAVILIVLFEIVVTLLATIKPAIWIKKMDILDASKSNDEIIDDINKNGNKLKTKKFIKKFGVEGVVADKYFKVNNKKYKKTMRGLTFSMVLFVVSSILCDLMNNATFDSIDKFGYDIEVCSEYESVSDIDSVYERTKSEYYNAKNSFKSVNSIEKIMFLCEDEDAEDIGIINKSDISDNELKLIKEAENVNRELPDKIGFFVKDVYVDKDTYKEIIKSNNFDEDKYLNNPNSKGLLYNIRQSNGDSSVKSIINKNISNIVVEDAMGIMAYENRLGEGYISEYSIWPIIGDSDDMKNDMKITYKSDNKDEQEIVGDLITQNKPVGDVINTRIDGISSFKEDEILLIYPDTMMKKVNEYKAIIKTNNYQNTMYSLKAWMKENKLKESNMTDLIAMKNLWNRIIVLITLFAYTFVLFMTIVAIANVLNVISTNFYYRKRDYAMIQSVGMSDKGLRKMVIYESLNYGIKSIIHGFPVVLAISALIKWGTGELKTYFTGSNVLLNIWTCIKNILPWGDVLISIIAIFVVVFLSMFYSIYKIKKESIIETIKSTDI